MNRSSSSRKEINIDQGWYIKAVFMNKKKIKIIERCIDGNDTKI